MRRLLLVRQRRTPVHHAPSGQLLGTRHCTCSDPWVRSWLAGPAAPAACARGSAAPDLRRPAAQNPPAGFAAPPPTRPGEHRCHIDARRRALPGTSLPHRCPPANIAATTKFAVLRRAEHRCHIDVQGGGQPAALPARAASAPPCRHASSRRALPARRPASARLLPLRTFRLPGISSANGAALLQFSAVIPVFRPHGRDRARPREDHRAACHQLRARRRTAGPCSSS